MVQDTLGNRMKHYEKMETARQFMPKVPVYARIDGRSFSQFTKGMERPYDIDMTNAMIETTKALVRETNALIGYTQSDEISLVWFQDDYKSSIFFDGKIQKMVSQLSAIASVYFMREAMKYWPEKVVHKMPTFDARVFMLPNKEEATNAFVWREKDATKNSISMAAQHYYSHKELHGKNSSQKMDMLMEKGVNWNDYPVFFKRGVYVRNQSRTVTLDEAHLNDIPEKHRPTDNKVVRSFVESIDMPPITKVSNREDVIFHKQIPICYEQEPL